VEGAGIRVELLDTVELSEGGTVGCEGGRTAGGEGGALISDFVGL
jgi:hypothetical protein